MGRSVVGRPGRRSSRRSRMPRGVAADMSSDGDSVTLGGARIKQLAPRTTLESTSTGWWSRLRPRALQVEPRSALRLLQEREVDRNVPAEVGKGAIPEEQ